jgi:hypothetical protein
VLLEDYVSVIESPLVNISTDADTICLGSSAVLTATGADSYIWNTGQAMSAVDGAVVTVSPITSANYIVNGITAQGCADTSLQRIVVVTNPPPPSINVNGSSLIASSGVDWEWYFNGVLIEGANAQTYIPTENGNYNVRVYISGGCSSISGVFPVNFVGIEDAFDTDGYVLYPNPAEHSINVFIPESNVSWRLIDPTGKLVQAEMRQNSGWLIIPSTDLARGIYLMQFLNLQGKTVTLKVAVAN